ncbi:MAG: hypothetical protein ACUVWA_08815 [Candidatus Oleimicrobiaceae bacterium]
MQVDVPVQPQRQEATEKHLQLAFQAHTQNRALFHPLSPTEGRASSEFGPGDQRTPCTGADADCVAVPDITRRKPKVVVLFSAQELGAIGRASGRHQEGVGLHAKGSTAGYKAEAAFADSRRKPVVKGQARSSRRLRQAKGR